jgi:AraC-like DNA-binding protein
MEYLELPAPPPLDQLVHCFWFLRGNFRTQAPQAIVSDGRLEIILHLAQPFSRTDAIGRRTQQAEALVSGQLTAPIYVSGNGDGDVIGIRFRTASAACVLRSPLADLTDRVEPLDDVSRSLAAGLLAAARRHHGPEQRVQSLARVLGGRLVAPPDRLAGLATHALANPMGGRIESVARALGTTPRTLERRLTIATGLRPATLRRVMRFRRAFGMLERTPRGSWTRIAVRSGYSDQAHLIRDFRQFAGAAPSDFFKADAELARVLLASEADG